MTNLDALHTLRQAASYLLLARCPEHFQGFNDMSKADQAAVNILDYAVRGVRNTELQRRRDELQHSHEVHAEMQSMGG